MDTVATPTDDKPTKLATKLVVGDWIAGGFLTDDAEPVEVLSTHRSGATLAVVFRYTDGEQVMLASVHPNEWLPLAVPADVDLAKRTERRRRFVGAFVELTKLLNTTDLPMPSWGGLDVSIHVDDTDVLDRVAETLGLEVVTSNQQVSVTWPKRDADDRYGEKALVNVRWFAWPKPVDEPAPAVEDTGLLYSRTDGDGPADECEGAPVPDDANGTPLAPAGRRAVTAAPGGGQ